MSAQVEELPAERAGESGDALSLAPQPVEVRRNSGLMALVGGVLTLLFGAWHIMRRQRDRIAIPYGVAIAFGGLWVLGTNYLPPAGQMVGAG